MGFDVSRIVGMSSNELSEFTCGICLGIFNKPVFTKCCQQTFCKECITGWLASSETCPNDRTFLENDDLSPVPRLVNNLLMNLLIKCDYEEYGCGAIVKIGDLEKHIETCAFVKCPTCGLKRSNIDEFKRLSDEMNLTGAAQRAFQEAKTASENYDIESYSVFTRYQCQLLVDICRTAINMSNTIDDLTANLFVMLYNVSRDFDTNEKWTVIAHAENGEISYSVDFRKSFRIKFGELKISFFTTT